LSFRAIVLVGNRKGKIWFITREREQL
jgi:ribosomal protein S5